MGQKFEQDLSTGRASYQLFINKKWVSYLYRTAQPPTLASFRTWGSSAGAGRIRLTRRKSINFVTQNKKRFLFIHPGFKIKSNIFASNNLPKINTYGTTGQL
jgi:hypothetical protein